MSCKDIYDDMLVILGDDAASYRVVKNCVAEVEHDRSSVVV